MTNSTQTSMKKLNSGSVRVLTDPALKASTVPEIIKHTIEQATRLLDATKVEYIIRLSDGTLITKGAMELTATRTRQPRSEGKMPYGSYTAAYKEPVSNMQVGDVLCFYRTPEMIAAGVTLGDIGRAISSMATTMFGNEAHKIFRNKTAECVEVLRTA